MLIVKRAGMRATRASVTIVPVSLDFAVFVFSVLRNFKYRRM